MKKYFFLEPRQTGKTTKAIFEFLKEPDTTLFVTHNNEMVKHVQGLSGIRRNICTAEQFIQPDFTRSKKIYKVIMDEYLFFNKKEKVYNKFSSCPSLSDVKELLIYSTSDKIYDRKMFDFVVDYKKRFSHTFNDLMYSYIVERVRAKDIPSCYNNNLEPQLSDLYYNFLTDSTTKIITPPFNHGRLFDNSFVEHLKLYNPTSYKTEILGKYLTEELPTLNVKAEADLIFELSKEVNKMIDKELDKLRSNEYPFSDIKVTYEYIPTKK